MCYIWINKFSWTSAINRSTSNYLEERRRIEKSPVTAQTDDQVDAVWDIVKTWAQQDKTPSTGDSTESLKSFLNGFAANKACGEVGLSNSRKKNFKLQNFTQANRHDGG